MKRRTTSRVTTTLVATALLAACSGTDEIISGTALVATAAEAPGANCEFGGTAVSYGVDLNENGALDAAEVASTSYVCADEGGGAPLVSTSAEPAGDNCEFGGFAIASGADTNGDGSLGADEITDTTYACAGEPAPVATPLGATTEEPAGDNCEFGGQRVDVGVDTNSKGTLEASEITSTLFACADATGSLASSTTYLDDADAACAGGYVERSFGVDADGNGTLEASEVGAAFTACNLAPAFAAERTFFVDSCTDGGTFDLDPFDMDGTVSTVSVEVIRSVEDVSVAVDGDGVITLTGGSYTAGAILEATATDEFGVESSARFTLVFMGEGCEPLDAFHGVDPDSCREISISSAGDDRGNATLSPSWVYYNGDEALIRTDRDLNNLEAVVFGSVDTLFHDNATEELYSLWSSTFTFDNVLDSDGALEDEGNSEIGAWDQIVQLDEDTLTVTRTVTLTPPIPVPYGDDVNIGTESEPVLMDPYYVFVAMRGDRLAVGVQGYSSEGSTNAIVLRVYNSGTGALLNTLIVTESDEAYGSIHWDTQEVDLQHFPIWVRDEVEYVLLPVNSEGTSWNEINMRDGSFTTASSTFASNCDQQNVAVDVTGLRAYAHNEYGCWGGGTYVDEALAVCQTQLVPNDGSIDDSGDGGD